MNLISESVVLPDAICFDHDLGEGPSGYDSARYICDYCMSEDLTLSWVIRRAIKEFLDKNYNIFAVSGDFVFRSFDECSEELRFLCR